MGNIIVIAVLVIIVILAIKGSTKHFKGEGGCCGGGGSCDGCAPKPKKKELAGEKIGEKVIHIEGMHCENCKASVEKAINAMDGAAAEVNLQHKIARVSLSKDIEDEVLKNAVEKAGFTVRSIEKK